MGTDPPLPTLFTLSSVEGIADCRPLTTFSICQRSQYNRPDYT
jgi:hypothetical protein